MARIATYVFLDLETTSIPCQELNKTRIVELSMVALKRRHMLETRAGATPRVQHKLTLCFNPGRTIDPGATDVTGLDNFLVEYETPFNIKVFNTIDSFLECFEKPVCLIAENGHRFDFPILKKHFDRLKVQLADDILCADSLYAFYDILKTLDVSIDIDTSCRPQNVAICVSTETLNELNEINLERNALNNNGQSTNLSTLKQDEVKPPKYETNIIDIELESPLYMKQQNEATPKTSKFKIKPAKKMNEARRKLFYQGDAKPKLKFKLKDIYERVLGRPAIEAHRAENDCLMAAEVAIAKINQFVEWVDKNHCAFSEVKPMTPGVPLGY